MGRMDYIITARKKGGGFWRHPAGKEDMESGVTADQIARDILKPGRNITYRTEKGGDVEVIVRTKANASKTDNLGDLDER